MKDTTPSTTFGLIRHAETLWNLEKKIQGHLDSPLSPKGEKMAETWGKRLQSQGWEHIITSDLGRAVKTCALINATLQLPTSTEKSLREMNWGEWTGRVYKHIRKSAPEAMRHQVEKGWGFNPPGGESRRSVAVRSMLGLGKSAEKQPGKKILVITHEGVIQCLINHLLDRLFLHDEPAVVKSFHLHELRHDGDKLMIGRINAFNLNNHKGISK